MERKYKSELSGVIHEMASALHDIGTIASRLCHLSQRGKKNTFRLGSGALKNRAARR